MVDLLVLGGGKSIFPGDNRRRLFSLVPRQTTTTGAIVATYASSAT